MYILTIFENTGNFLPKRMFAITTACLLAFVAARANAGIIADIYGNAIEVTDVDVNGTNYDVSFKVGSFDDVYGTGFPVSPEPLLNGASTTVVQAVRDEISSQLLGGGFTAVSDASGNPYDFFIVSSNYSMTNSAGHYGTTETAFLGGGDWRGGTISIGRNAEGAPTDFTGASTTFTFARFTASPVAVTVPEANSFVLFGIAMAGLTRRSRK